jgi:hypothetical protein
MCRSILQKLFLGIPLAWTFFILCSVLCPPKVQAVSVAIPNFPATITSDSFTITASVSGAAAGINYLRVDVYKEGTSNYFGETFNNLDWYGGAEGKQYLPISIISGTPWVGSVKARIGTPSSSDYDGTGSYRMRVRRYTSSGGLGSEDANNSSVAISLSFPTSTPTLMPSVTPTDAPKPTPTPKPLATITTAPTERISGASISLLSVTPKIPFFPTRSVKQSSSSAAQHVKQRNEAPTPKLVASITPQVKVLGASDTGVGKFLIVSGILILLSSCGILALYYYKQYKGE